MKKNREPKKKFSILLNIFYLMGPNPQIHLYDKKG
jgi:hypothetical protein